jgi:hypothetical protein
VSHSPSSSHARNVNAQELFKFTWPEHGDYAPLKLAMTNISQIAEDGTMPTHIARSRSWQLTRPCANRICSTQ